MPTSATSRSGSYGRTVMRSRSRPARPGTASDRGRAVVRTVARSDRTSAGSTAAPSAPVAAASASAGPPTTAVATIEQPILFQKYFKSVGPRTYAAQMKQAANGNQFLVLTEGRRDPSTGEIRKTKLLVFSEDFVSFFRMLHETAQWIRSHPLPEDVRKKRERYWARKAGGNGRTVRQ